MYSNASEWLFPQFSATAETMGKHGKELKRRRMNAAASFSVLAAGASDDDAAASNGEEEAENAQTANRAAPTAVARAASAPQQSQSRAAPPPSDAHDLDEDEDAPGVKPSFLRAFKTAASVCWSVFQECNFTLGCDVHTVFV